LQGPSDKVKKMGAHSSEEASLSIFIYAAFARYTNISKKMKKKTET